MQVLLRNRSDSNPVQDELLNKQTGSFMVELSRPPPPPTKAPFTVALAPNGEIEGHQSEFPEGMKHARKARTSKDMLQSLRFCGSFYGT